MDLAIDMARPEAADRLLAGALGPRPLAALSTIGPRSGDAFVTVVSRILPLAASPPTVAVVLSERDPRATRALVDLEDSGEFVLNLLSVSMVKDVAAHAGPLPEPHRGPVRSNVDVIASTRILPPGLRRSPVRLECVLAKRETVGRDRRSWLLTAEVVLVHADDAVLDAKAAIDPIKANLAAWVGPDLAAWGGHAIADGSAIEVKGTGTR